MGLAEKRAIKRFETEKFPAFKKQMDEACGFTVQVEVHWDSLEAPAAGNAELLDDALPKVFFTPLVEAFRAICIDDLGRDALKGKLKKVDVGYGGESSEISFTNGILTLHLHPTTNIDDWGERKDSLQKELELAL